jgi:hypothetical protein
MTKQEIIEHLREMADAIESGSAEVTSVEVVRGLESDCFELKVGVQNVMRLKDNHTP